MNYRENILAGLDWDEGLSMPVANADNKLLEDEVNELNLFNIHFWSFNVLKCIKIHSEISCIFVHVSICV